jgi:ribosomal protein S1
MSGHVTSRHVLSGVLLEVLRGKEAFCHVSELSHHPRGKALDQLVAPGQKFKVSALLGNG